MFSSELGTELFLIAILATFLGIAINNFIRNQADRARKALHQRRIQTFIETADRIEEATYLLTQDIPAEAMDEMLREASIADLYAIHSAITKAKSATQRLEASHLNKINAIAKSIGLAAEPAKNQGGQQNGGGGKPQNQNNGGGGKPQQSQDGNQPQNQNNGGDSLEKAGKRLIGEMRARLAANGNNIEFGELLNKLREQHGINAADFAALPEARRQEIESSLR